MVQGRKGRDQAGFADSVLCGDHGGRRAPTVSICWLRGPGVDKALRAGRPGDAQDRWPSSLRVEWPRSGKGVDFSGW